jgi:tetratricopeptide (TPR) repeat protein
VAQDLEALALVLSARDDVQGALSATRAALRTWERLSPGDNLRVALGLKWLGQLLARGGAAEAEASFEASLAMLRRLVPRDEEEAAHSRSALADLLRRKDDLPGAEALLRQAVAMRKNLYPAGDDRLAVNARDLAFVVKDRGDLTGAVPLFQEAVAMCERRFGSRHIETLRTRGGLALTLRLLGRFTEAEGELLAAESVLSSTNDAAPSDRQEFIAPLVQLYEAWHQAEPGKGHDAKAVTWKDKLAAESQPASRPVGSR